MSDTKPKRPMRESVRSVISPIPAPDVAETLSVLAETVAPPVAPTPLAPTMVEPLPALPAPLAFERPAAALGDPWAVFAETQSAFARSVEALTTEVTEAANSSMARTSHAMLALIGAKTFAEALEINTALVRQGVDTALESSAKLSEIGVKAMTDASRPWLSHFGMSLAAFGIR